MLISIHAPLTGSDNRHFRKNLRKQISIHAPLTGSDSCFFFDVVITNKFQSTLPLRGATF